MYSGTIKTNLSKNIDSVIIEYWNSFYANTFIFNVSNDSDIRFKGEKIFKEEKTVNSLEKHNRLMNYINQFYIDKEDEIILKKTLRGYIESTDYPFIKVIGYRENKEVFNKNVQIGEERYEIEYHPEFIEFYEFLERLIEDR